MADGRWQIQAGRRRTQGSVAEAALLVSPKRSDWRRSASGKGEMTNVIPLQGETAYAVPLQLRVGRVSTQGDAVYWIRQIGLI